MANQIVKQKLHLVLFKGLWPFVGIRFGIQNILVSEIKLSFGITTT